MSPVIPHPNRTPYGYQTVRDAVIVLLVLIAQIANAQDTHASTEYKLKGVFLFNFLQFTEWPASAFENPSSPLVIGILGKDPFGTYLDSLVLNERINDRRVMVERYTNIDEMKKCHLLFIGREFDRYEPQIHRNLEGSPTLTVGESSQFAARGGMIRLYIQDNRIRMQINVNATKSASLALSSKLLSVASIWR